MNKEFISIILVTAGSLGIIYLAKKVLMYAWGKIARLDYEVTKDIIEDIYEIEVDSIETFEVILDSLEKIAEKRIITILTFITVLSIGVLTVINM